MSNSLQVDSEQIKATLESILSEIHESNDPEALNAYRAMFRKYVPLFSRAYVAAYMLMKLKPGAYVSGLRRPPVPPREGMVSVFIGVGKSRKVFPRDLVGMLIEQAGLAKEEIGNIKILDNYSFVEIKNEKSQKVIDTLNNFEYRGRPLTVNYARKRD